jgi:hypothetical protein
VAHIQTGMPRSTAIITHDVREREFLRVGADR